MLVKHEEQTNTGERNQEAPKQSGTWRVGNTARMHEGPMTNKRSLWDTRWETLDRMTKRPKPYQNKTGSRKADWKRPSQLIDPDIVGNFLYCWYSLLTLMWTLMNSSVKSILRHSFTYNFERLPVVFSNSWVMFSSAHISRRHFHSLLLPVPPLLLICYPQTSPPSSPSPPL